MTMSYDDIFEKLSNQQLNFNPSLKDVMQRVREVGLHKVAAQIHGTKEFGFKEAAQALGTRLVEHHLKYAKVNEGIKALNRLAENGDVDLSKSAGMMSNVMSKLKPAAKGADDPFMAAAGKETAGFAGEGAARQARPEFQAAQELSPNAQQYLNQPSGQTVQQAAKKQLGWE